MHKLELTEQEGTPLTVYSSRSLGAVAPPRTGGQPREVADAEPHLRWHPLRGEWVAYVPGLYARPVPADDSSAPHDPVRPETWPEGDWEMAVIGRQVPALSQAARSSPDLPVPSQPATGSCEVVIFARDPNACLAMLPLAQLELLMAVWADRTTALSRSPDVRYVLPFEDRCAPAPENGRHPHGEIYAYPVVPPVPARMQDAAAAHYARYRKSLLQELIGRELATGRRVLYRGEHAAAFVPAFARHPYEVWVAPIRAVESFAQLTDAQRADLSRALKTALMKYEGLWDQPFPYLMAWYQAPLDGQPHPECHLHAELYPRGRQPERRRRPHRTELVGCLAVVDGLPEDDARDLQRVAVCID